VGGRNLKVLKIITDNLYCDMVWASQKRLMKEKGEV
jgi:hypothetical protein